MTKKYYAMLDGEQKGPFTLEQLPEAGVRPGTYIWCKGMADWEKAEEDADICRLFRNRIHDLMHPSSQQQAEEGNASPYNFMSNEEALKDKGPSGLRGMMSQLPTIEEIDSREETSTPPVSMVGYAWIVTLLFFPPTGIAALVCAYKSKSAWKEGENKLSYDYCKAAKMWTGITFFIGLIFYAFLVRFV